MDKLNILDCLRLYTQLNIDDINNIISKAPSNYRKFSIPKKNNSGKFRYIYTPATEIKMFQYILMNYYFLSYSVHPCAMAYVKGKKSPLRLNAEKHKSFKFSVHYDFSNFFYSIDSDSCLNAIKHKFNFSQDDLLILKNICFIKRQERCSLSIGSPISPILSNIYMFEFDTHLDNFAIANSGSYTRYSDDIIFSFNDKNVLTKLKQELYFILSDKQYVNLKINQYKTKFFKLNEPKRVTGLIITKDTKIHVPRKIKREVRHLIYKNNNRSKIETNRLKGLISYIKDVEPEYINKLVVKYGEKYRLIFTK